MKLDLKLNELIRQMANSPKTQIKRLAIGTSISAFSILLLMFVSHWEIQWLFNLLVVITAIGVLYAIPGYIGIWVWRMRDVLFRNDKEK